MLKPSQKKEGSPYSTVQVWIYCIYMYYGVTLILDTYMTVCHTTHSRCNFINTACMVAKIGSVPRETLPNRPPKSIRKKTYKKIKKNDGVQVENPGTTTLKKILLLHTDTDTVIQVRIVHTFIHISKRPTVQHFLCVLRHINR
jgi:hypothetical protein